MTTRHSITHRGQADQVGRDIGTSIDTGADAATLVRPLRVPMHNPRTFETAPEA